MLKTPTVKRETIKAARVIPPNIKMIAFGFLIPKRKAAAEPVQTPVIGMGMATKSNKTISPHLVC